MALYVIHTETAYTVLTADTSSVLELLGSANVSAELIEWGVSFNGVSSTQLPIQVRLRQITATGTGTAVTEHLFDRRGKATAACTGKHTMTAEPTFVSNSALYNGYVHPQGGSLVIQYPLGGRPLVCDGSSSQGLAIELTSGTGVTPQCLAYMVWSE